MNLCHLSGRRWLVTGASGSLGREVVRYILQELDPVQVSIVARNEFMISEMIKYVGDEQRLRIIVGDIRSRARLAEAMSGVDYVIHAAAMKRVDTEAVNEREMFDVNVQGSLNIISQAKESGVRRVVLVSTDKAVSPHSAYGESKRMAEELFTRRDDSSPRDLQTYVVRLGNLIGSSGSLVPLVRIHALLDNPFPITDRRMTRFAMRLTDAAVFICQSLVLAPAPQILVPKLSCFSVVDLIAAMAPDLRLFDRGMRSGEKVHESLVGADEVLHTYEMDDGYIICPDKDRIPAGVTISKVPDDFGYRSDLPGLRLGPDVLREMTAPWRVGKPLRVP
jgi:UDP-N-acetylglucosamine 4,6-dehydratase/5-epimerase